MFGAVLSDGGIRDLDAQFGQFRLDAPTAPGRIGLPHLVNQRDELTIDGGPSYACAGFPAPEQAKAKAMPGDNGFGLEQQQGLLPVRPNAPQANPKQSVGGAVFGFAGLAFKHGELMSERQILEHESGMGLEASEQAAE